MLLRDLIEKLLQLDKELIERGDTKAKVWVSSDFVESSMVVDAKLSQFGDYVIIETAVVVG